MKSEAASQLSMHRLDEAFKFAYAERGHLGDPHFALNVSGYEETILNDTTIQKCRDKLSDKHTLPSSEYNPEGLEIISDGTAHMIAVDATGLAITLTSTVNDLFGSHLMIPGTGIVMNDQMNDFSIPNVTNEFGYVPSPENFVRPGKRPLSSLAPTIVEHLENATFYLAVGAAGGSRIITSVAQSLWYILDKDMSPQEALARPRWHDQLQPNEVEMDRRFNRDTISYFREKGHNVTLVEPGMTDLYAIQLGFDGLLRATAEPNLVAAGVSVV